MTSRADRYLLSLRKKRKVLSEKNVEKYLKKLQSEDCNCSKNMEENKNEYSN